MLEASIKIEEVGGKVQVAFNCPECSSTKLEILAWNALRMAMMASAAQLAEKAGGTGHSTITGLPLQNISAN